MAKKRLRMRSSKRHKSVRSLKAERNHHYRTIMSRIYASTIQLTRKPICITKCVPGYMLWMRSTTAPPTKPATVLRVRWQCKRARKAFAMWTPLH